MSEVIGVDINIMGREFTVACPEEERTDLINAVNYLDKKMKDIQASGKIVGVERIAIMAALNITHELLSAKHGNFDIGDYKRRIEAMQEQIDAALDAASGKLF
ncbi:MAG TPA: cell division protein ZapA [Methylophilaceae bacterium]|jgi:cell division protein ZapA